MTPERFEVVREIFLALRELPEEARRERLATECRGDTELTQLVERLLAVDGAGPHTLLDEPVLNAARSFIEVEEAAARASPAPTRLDKYRLIRLLGAGSVGDVFLAEQDEPIRRSVAIKLLRPMDTGSRHGFRFGIEREALSKLSHPNIAGIIDAGCGADGRAYIVMELVRGVRIDEHLRANATPFQERLDLFLQLCAGVQHAHHRGVIHRDLKPANVMVVDADGSPSVKIVDFGIAKLLGDGSTFEHTLTAKGQILGTLSFMSPEQLNPSRGGVDSRSDVYALGVMLYLIASGGRMPFGTTVSGLMHALSPDEHEALPPLIEAPKGCRRDMAAVVRKALEHDPDRRYPSPAHLADDVRRVLDGEPVLATNPSLLHRAGKLAKRRPRTTGVLALGVAAIVTLGVLNVFAVIRLEQQVSVERDTVSALIDDSVERIRRISGALEGRRSLAESLLAQTDRLLEGRPNDPKILMSRARLLDELSDIALTEHQSARCLELRLEASAIYSRLVADAPHDVELGRRHAEAIVKIGDMMGPSVTPRESLTHYTRALAIHEAMVSKHPGHAGLQDDLSWSYERVGRMHELLGDRDRAVEFARLRLRVSEELVSRWPDRSLSHHSAAWAHLHVAELLSGEDERAVAASHYVRALRYAEHAAHAEPQWLHLHYSLVQIRVRNTEHLLRLGRFGEAEALAVRAIVETDRLARDNPERRDLAAYTLSTRLLLARTYSWACDAEGMQRSAQELLAVVRGMDQEAITRSEHLVCSAYKLLDRAHQMRALPAGTAPRDRSLADSH